MAKTPPKAQGKSARKAHKSPAKAPEKSRLSLKRAVAAYNNLGAPTAVTYADMANKKSGGVCVLDFIAQHQRSDGTEEGKMSYTQEIRRDVIRTP